MRLQLFAQGIPVNPEQLRRTSLVTVNPFHYNRKEGLLNLVYYHAIQVTGLLPVQVIKILVYCVTDAIAKWITFLQLVLFLLLLFHPETNA